MLFKIFQVFIAWRLCHARLLSHSVELYNEMLDYPIARQYAWDTTTINQLGEVFLEHKVNDTFGLTLLHNHFHLQPGEQMIEVVYNGSSRTEPHLIEDQPSNIVPHTFKLTEEGHLIPIEYIDVSLSDVQGIDVVAAKLDSYHDFFQDLAKALKKFKKLDHFGVGIRHRDSIREGDPFGSTLETNNPRLRFLEVTPLSAKPFYKSSILDKLMNGVATSTFWSFPMKGDGQTLICAECGCHHQVCAECACAA